MFSRQTLNRYRSRAQARRGFTLIEIMIIIGIMGIVIAIAVPGWLRARSQSQMKACQENLSKIAGAKEQWALEFNAGPTVTPSWSVLTDGSSEGDRNGILKEFPEEPAGGTYNINPMNQDPTCSTGLPGHSLAEVGFPIISDGGLSSGGS